MNGDGERRGLRQPLENSSDPGSQGGMHDALRSDGLWENKITSSRVLGKPVRTVCKKKGAGPAMLKTSGDLRRAQRKMFFVCFYFE